MTTIDLGDWAEAEVARLCEEARAGKNADWALWCENSSLEMLVEIYRLLNNANYQQGVVRQCLAEIETLITKWAEAEVERSLNDCTCTAPPVRYNTVSPPEPVLNKDCPAHGSIDYREER